MRSCNRAGVDRKVRMHRVVMAWGFSALVLAGGAAVRGQEASGLGKLDSPTGTLLRRGGSDKEWKVVAKDAAVPDRDLLLALPGVRAVIFAGKGAVRLTLAGNVPQQSPIPSLESAVTLRQSADLDLDVILERGRIQIANTREKGAANIRVRARDEVWELTLGGPDTEVSLELTGRWPPGLPYRAQYKEGEEPTAELDLLVLKGSVDLKAGGRTYTLRSPPGPALYSWTSAFGPAPTPRGLQSLPPWIVPGADEKGPAAVVRDVLKPLMSSLADKGASTALADLLASADKAQDKEHGAAMRELAVTGFGAVDDLAHLVDALNNDKHSDERLFAVEALRHWIGRRPGQDAQLARFLIRDRKYSPEHATTFLQLLHSYGSRSIEDPVTYELLIAYLSHDKLAVRELAAWHLYRLAPAGADIKYDPAGSKEDVERAVKAWKQLIPSGQLPPPPKEK